MALPNNDPIFSKIGVVGGVRCTAINAKSDGAGTIGTDIFLAFTADATNGSFVQRVRFSYCNTSAGTAATTTSAVGRVYISSATSGATTATNTHLWGEINLPPIATDGDLGGNATPVFDIPLNVALGAGQTILVSIGASGIAANTEFKAIVIGGNY